MKIKNSFLGYLLLFLFIVLALRLAYLEVWAFPKIRLHPRNTRPVLKELSFERGQILDRSGKIIAESFLERSGFYKRRYPFKELFFHPVGYFDPQLGSSGLEKKLDSYLGSQSLTIQKKAERGMKVVLTLDADLQKKAFQLLRGGKGVILAINPQTGEVLTYASSPSVSLEKIKSEMGKNLKNQPLVDRISQGLYPPGSVFKIVTLAAALKEGWPLSKTFKAPARLKVENGKVTNYQKRSYGVLSLEKAFEKSVNTVFAQVALALGREKIKKEAEKFGFNQEVSFDLPVKKSRFPLPLERIDLAWQAVGQGKVLATPLQLGILVSAVANGGVLKTPILIKKVETSDGQVFSVGQAKTKFLLKPDVALKIKEAMVRTVNYGTGRQAKLTGIQLGGKTGTAELDSGKPHSWFVCFAPAEKPSIVLIALVEHGGLGGRKAALLTREFLKYFFTEKSQVLVE